jgi:hypothetical protein
MDWLENPDLSKKPKYADHYVLRNNTLSLYRANYDEFGQLWRLVVPKSEVKAVIK